LHEARLNELVREMKLKCAGQNVVQAHELQLQEEKRRQASLRQAMETIKDAAQRIHTAIEVEDSFATSTFFPRDDLGPLAVTKAPASLRPHPDAAESTADDQVDVAIEDDLSQVEQAKVRVRNTFIELWVPESEAPPLRRTRTAPSEVLPAFANQRPTHHAAKAV